MCVMRSEPSNHDESKELQSAQEVTAEERERERQLDRERERERERDRGRERERGGGRDRDRRSAGSSLRDASRSRGIS